MYLAVAKYRLANSYASSSSPVLAFPRYIKGLPINGHFIKPFGITTILLLLGAFATTRNGLHCFEIVEF